MAFSENLDPFLRQTDFASAAIIGGSAVSGIFDYDYDEALGVEGSSPQLTVKTDAVPIGTTHGTTVLIAATAYRIVEIQPDGTGLTVLILEKVG